MAEPSVCAESIQSLRKLRQISERAQAATRRQAELQSAGDSASPALAEMIDDLEPNEGWAYCICWEGYGYYPDQQLGFYVLTRPVHDVLFCQAHFTCVHFKCQRQAKDTKPDWDAAAVRNVERPCNAIFPIPSATMPAASYLEALNKFYERCSRGHSIRNCVAKVRFHIHKIATGDLANSIAFIPFLVYAGHILLDVQARENQRLIAERRMEQMILGAEDPSDAFALALWVM
jgi:E3 ubiquitin-protein ligase UBR4